MRRYFILETKKYRIYTVCGVSQTPIEKYKIDRRVRNMLMIVYFYDRFVPVCVEKTMDNCLKRVSISLEKSATMVEKI